MADVPKDIMEAAELVKSALIFADKAAGEGISIDGIDPEDFIIAYSLATGDEDWDTLPDRISALLSERERRTAQGVGNVVEPLYLKTIAYNAGLEIRYAIAASGIDPIQHIPEVDAIIERRLSEAFERAAQIAETPPHDYGWQTKGDERRARAIAAAIRQAGKDGGAACGKPVDGDP